MNEMGKVGIYFAPLEGITGYLYRNIFHKHFGGVDRYFIPFIQPKQHGHFSSREKKDILPEHNGGMKAVPQLLTNQAPDFLQTSSQLAQMGYEEVNLNLGCPSRTVVSKGRGAGQLGNLEELDRFLETVFKKAEVKISVKTRLGLHSPEEFAEIIKIYQRYPLSELIIHPRVQQEYYEGKPHIEAFVSAYQSYQEKEKLCYNGDIFSTADYEKLLNQVSDISKVMLGRGLLRNPDLAQRLKGEGRADKMQLKAFHDDLYQAYQEALSGQRTVLFKMKEFWVYMADAFEDAKKAAKKIKKAQKLSEYEQAVESMFESELVRTE
jgi:tRNA-dihydrouridine synthase